jgi:hypothetical protein
MTIALVLACSDGIGMASDSEVSTGPFRQIAGKIYNFGDRILWTGSGNLSLIQKTQQQIAFLPRENMLSPLHSLADTFQEMAVNAMSQARDRHRRALASPNAEPTVDLLFASWDGQNPLILHVNRVEELSGCRVLAGRQQVLERCLHIPF